MPNQSDDLDRLFQAIGDPTRRAVLEQLSAGPAPVSRLAEPFHMALPSFLQHLKVLENCGLVHSQKKGPIRTYHLSTQILKLDERWLVEQRNAWVRRLNQFDDFLKEMKKKS